MTYTGCRGRRSAEFSEGSVYDVIEYFLLYFARVRPDFHHCNPANRRLCPSPTGHGRHLLLNGGKIPVAALGHIRELQASRLIPGVSAGAGQHQEVHPLTVELPVDCVGYARAVGVSGIETPVLGQAEGQSVNPDCLVRSHCRPLVSSPVRLICMKPTPRWPVRIWPGKAA